MYIEQQKKQFLYKQDVGWLYLFKKQEKYMSRNGAGCSTKVSSQCCSIFLEYYKRCIYILSI